MNPGQKQPGIPGLKTLIPSRLIINIDPECPDLKVDTRRPTFALKFAFPYKSIDSVIS